MRGGRVLSRVTCNCHGAHDARAQKAVAKYGLQLMSGGKVLRFVFLGVVVIVIVVVIAIVIVIVIPIVIPIVIMIVIAIQCSIMTWQPKE